jgi:hypothetical protein
MHNNYQIARASGRSLQYLLATLRGPYSHVSGMFAASNPAEYHPCYSIEAYGPHAAALHMHCMTAADSQQHKQQHAPLQKQLMQ